MRVVPRRGEDTRRARYDDRRRISPSLHHARFTHHIERIRCLIAQKNRDHAVTVRGKGGVMVQRYWTAAFRGSQSAWQYSNLR